VVRDFAEYDSGGKHSFFKMDDLEHPSHRSLAGGGSHRGPMKTLPLETRDAPSKFQSSAIRARSEENYYSVIRKHF
jgi:hypothetical protein